MVIDNADDVGGGAMVHNLKRIMGPAWRLKWCDAPEEREAQHGYRMS